MFQWWQVVSKLAQEGWMDVWLLLRADEAQPFRYQQDRWFRVPLAALVLGRFFHQFQRSFAHYAPEPDWRLLPVPDGFYASAHRLERSPGFGVEPVRCRHISRSVEERHRFPTFGLLLCRRQGNVALELELGLSRRFDRFGAIIRLDSSDRFFIFGDVLRMLLSVEPLARHFPCLGPTSDEPERLDFFATSPRDRQPGWHHLTQNVRVDRYHIDADIGHAVACRVIFDRLAFFLIQSVVPDQDAVRRLV